MATACSCAMPQKRGWPKCKWPKPPSNAALARTSRASPIAWSPITARPTSNWRPLSRPRVRVFPTSCCTRIRRRWSSSSSPRTRMPSSFSSVRRSTARTPNSGISPGRRCPCCRITCRWSPHYRRTCTDLVARCRGTDSQLRAAVPLQNLATGWTMPPRAPARWHQGFVRQHRPRLAASCLHSARGRMGIISARGLAAACGSLSRAVRGFPAFRTGLVWCFRSILENDKGCRMHLLDITMLHGPAVGGVSRYLSTKRRWIRDNTRVRHSQLVAAPAAGRGTDGEFLLPGVRLPLCGPLHWPLDAARWIDTIGALAPDVIEANDVGSAAWFALAAARKMDVPLLGFAHVDLVRFARERKGAHVFAGRDDDGAAVVERAHVSDDDALC